MASISRKPILTNNLEMWRSFFREYLRYVSEMDPDITPVRKEIRETMDRIKANPDFSQVFLEDAQGSTKEPVVTLESFKSL